MDFYREIYETLNVPVSEVAEAYGLEPVVIETHRRNIRQFLTEHQWTNGQDYIQWYSLHRILPGTGQQVVNLLTSAVEHLWSGAHNVDDTEAIERFAICKACEHLAEQERCTMCGCFMKVKSKWKDQKCPIAKW